MPRKTVAKLAATVTPARAGTTPFNITAEAPDAVFAATDVSEGAITSVPVAVANVIVLLVLSAL